MRNATLLVTCVILWTCLHLSCTQNRGPRIFPLLSLVQFPNIECLADDLRSGTCLVLAQCVAMGGIPTRLCGLSFGTCCIFQVSCNSQMQYNSTQFVNPSFPSNDSTLFGDCNLSVLIPDNTCSLYLQMREFNISQPHRTTCNKDYFYVKDKPFVPVICGENAGQHMYIDVNGDTMITLLFQFDGTKFDRIWNMKINYIECDNPSRPPQGCLQYFTGMTGTVTSFNFYNIRIHNETEEEIEEDVYYISSPQHPQLPHVDIETVFIEKPHPHPYYRSTYRYNRQYSFFKTIMKYNFEDDPFYDIVPRNATHLAYQNYGICVLRAPNVCRLAWTALTFDLSGNSSEPMAVRGDSCQEDYVMIPKGTVQGEKASYDRYCGNILGPTGANTSVTVSTDAQPFHIRFVTNGSDPLGVINRGFNLTYSQILCKDCIGVTY